MIAAPVGAVQDTTCRADRIEIASAAAGNDLSMQIMMPHIDPAAWRPLCRAMLAFLLGGWLGMSGPGLSRAALSIYLPPESLARIAPLILQGTVTRTASGFDPDTTRLATYITLEVEKVLRGPADLTQVVIREPGGRYGSLVHEIDAVPLYQTGEQVLVFLKPAADGALETAGLFFGKFTIEFPRRRVQFAVRDLSGAGIIGGFHADGPRESLRASVLTQAAAAIPLDSGIPEAFRPHPVGMDQLLWDDLRELTPASPGSSSTPAPPASTGRRPLSSFVALSTVNPTRWHQSDSSLPVLVDIERAGNPLGDGLAAVAELERAMAAWTNVPEARLELRSGNTDVQYVAAHPSSPTSAFPPSNIILFNDPYGDITNQVGCAGVLAVGGYWRGSTPKKLINNVNFNPALRLYLIFNDGFECFLANPDNLAEVATHELGHGIGFGHSSVPDAIMRSSAYGNRGPRLGLDDQDAVHCHYPHTFTLVSPRGGDVLQAGTIHRILWNSSFEAGPDTGALDIDLSLDGGTSWSSIVKLTPNDGAFDWLVPATTTSLARIRLIRPNQVSPTPSPYPAACSQVNSAASFAISPPQAGLVPDGGTAPPLLLAPAPGGLITFTWGGSCSAGATDYAIYEGSLSALHSGVWDLSPLTCSAGTDLTQTVAPSPGARYYLVTALTGAAEGSPGWSSSGAPRPASATACLPQEAPGCS